MCDRLIPFKPVPDLSTATLRALQAAHDHCDPRTATALLVREVDAGTALFIAHAYAWQVVSMSEPLLRQAHELGMSTCRWGLAFERPAPSAHRIPKPPQRREERKRAGWLGAARNLLWSRGSEQEDAQSVEADAQIGTAAAPFPTHVAACAQDVCRLIEEHNGGHPQLMPSDFDWTK